MLTELWATRLRGTGVTVHAMHPGWAYTPGLQTSLPALAEGGGLGWGVELRSAEEGADTAVWLASTGTQPLAADASAQGGVDAGRLLREGGGFWLDRRPVPADFPWAGTRSSTGEFAALWAACEDTCGFVFADSLAGAAVAEAAAGGPGSAEV